MQWLIAVFVGSLLGLASAVASTVIVLYALSMGLSLAWGLVPWVVAIAVGVKWVAIWSARTKGHWAWDGNGSL